MDCFVPCEGVKKGLNMPRFAANLGWMFQEWTMEDRFVAAGQAGFKGVEVPFPYDIEMGKLGDLLSMNNLELACFNAPAGDWQAGERGLAALPGRKEEFFDGLYQAFELADFLESKRIHLMAGIIPEDADFDVVYETYISNLQRACKEARDEDVTLLIEPISEGSVPGYMLQTAEQALAVIEDVDDSLLKLQLDIYHAQNMQGRITETIEASFAELEHIQIAGVPDRCEPDTGEVNYPYLFDMLDAHGYSGWVGLEYTPRLGTLAGLRWAKPWGISKDGVTIPPSAPKADDKKSKKK